MGLVDRLDKADVRILSIDDKKLYDAGQLVDVILLAIAAERNHEYARTLSKNVLRGQIKAAMESRNPL